MMHTISVLVENKPGRAHAHHVAVRAPRLQHREPRGRADRAPRRVAHHDARQLRAAHARADREADAQARQRPARRRSSSRARRSSASCCSIKVAVPPDRRAELMALGEVFHARVVDLGPDALIFEVVGRPRSSSRSRSSSRPHGIKELVRTGRVGLARASSARQATPRARASRSFDAAGPTAGIDPAKPAERTTMARSSAKANVDLLSGKVAVIGYGSQGHAHALNLHDSGVTVEVGLRDGSEAARRPRTPASTVRTIPEAVAGAQLVALLLPDQVQPKVYAEEIEPNLGPTPRSSSRTASTSSTSASSPTGHDVIMVAPKGPGPHRPPPLHGGPRHAGADRRRAGRERRARASSRSPTPSRSARAARECSRRPSRRRRRPTSSASRPCSAAASPS